MYQISPSNWIMMSTIFSYMLMKMTMIMLNFSNNQKNLIKNKIKMYDK